MTPTGTASPTEPRTTAQLSLLVIGDSGVPAVDATVSRTMRSCVERSIECHSIDVWNESESAVALGVLTVPTVVAFVNGIEISRLVGPLSPRRVDRFLDALPVEQRAARVWLHIEHPEILPAIPKTPTRPILRLLSAVRTRTTNKRIKVQGDRP